MFWKLFELYLTFLDDKQFFWQGQTSQVRLEPEEVLNNPYTWETIGFIVKSYEEDVASAIDKQDLVEKLDLRKEFILKRIEIEKKSLKRRIAELEKKGPEVHVGHDAPEDDEAENKSKKGKNKKWIATKNCLVFWIVAKLKCLELEKFCLMENIMLLNCRKIEMSWFGKICCNKGNNEIIIIFPESINFDIFIGSLLAT